MLVITEFVQTISYNKKKKKRNNDVVLTLEFVDSFYLLSNLKIPKRLQGPALCISLDICLASL